MHTYQPQPLKTFILRDPKTRKISRSAFRDRVIHHAICNIIEPVFDKSFISDSFANRKNKGTLNAIKRFDVFKRKVSKNNSIRCYVLKADIKSYFGTVDHKILLNILQRKIKDKKVIWLITKILQNHQGKETSKGMPLGNLTSQFFANVYLNELDQFIKHKLKAKYYIRYVDDFVILHQSKTILDDYIKQIDNFLSEKLDLKLHPDKSQILKLDKGVNFLGFRIFHHHKLLVKRNMRKFEKKLQQLRTDYQNDKVEREKVIERFEGWIAYAKHANTYKYRKNITGKFNTAFPVEKEFDINSVKKHENLNDKIYASNIEFTHQKTLKLLRKELRVKQISKLRNIKEGTVWEHIAKLIEHHQLKLKNILPNNKIKNILKNIKTPDDKLKDIKEKISDDSISYNEINCVLANIKGKQKKKNILYFINWYKRTNCYRKCYYNKKQREQCRIKFQQLAAKSSQLEFNKKEFLEFFNNHVNICVLPEKRKKEFVNWSKHKKIQITKVIQ